MVRLLLDASADVGGQREVWELIHPVVAGDAMKRQSILVGGATSLRNRIMVMKMKMKMNVNISMKMNMNYSVYDSRDNKMTMQISFAAVGIDSSFCK